MPKKTYVQISRIVLAATVSSVTFSLIPQNFKDLVVVFNGTTQATGGRNFLMRFNNDSGSNYSNLYMFASGSSAASAAGTSNAGLNVIVDNTPSIAIANIMDYSTINKNKTIIGRGNSASVAIDMRITTWLNTSAITSITMLPDSLSWLSGSTFTVYGIEG
jgi:hypothetical protein